MFTCIAAITPTFTGSECAVAICPYNGCSAKPFRSAPSIPSVLYLYEQKSCATFLKPGTERSSRGLKAVDTNFLNCFVASVTVQFILNKPKATMPPAYVSGSSENVNFGPYLCLFRAQGRKALEWEYHDQQRSRLPSVLPVQVCLARRLCNIG